MVMQIASPKHFREETRSGTRKSFVSTLRSFLKCFTICPSLKKRQQRIAPTEGCTDDGASCSETGALSTTKYSKEKDDGIKNENTNIDYSEDTVEVKLKSWETKSISKDELWTGSKSNSCVQCNNPNMQSMSEKKYTKESKTRNNQSNSSKSAYSSNEPTSEDNESCKSINYYYLNENQQNTNQENETKSNNLYNSNDYKTICFEYEYNEWYDNKENELEKYHQDVRKRYEMVLVQLVSKISTKTRFLKEETIFETGINEEGLLKENEIETEIEIAEETLYQNEDMNTEENKYELLNEVEIDTEVQNFQYKLKPDEGMETVINGQDFLKDVDIETLPNSLVNFEKIDGMKPKVNELLSRVETEIEVPNIQVNLELDDDRKNELSRQKLSKNVEIEKNIPDIHQMNLNQIEDETELNKYKFLKTEVESPDMKELKVNKKITVEAKENRLSKEDKTDILSLNTQEKVQQELLTNTETNKHAISDNKLTTEVKNTHEVDENHLIEKHLNLTEIDSTVLTAHEMDKKQLAINTSLNKSEDIVFNSYETQLEQTVCKILGDLFNKIKAEYSMVESSQSETYNIWHSTPLQNFRRNVNSSKNFTPLFEGIHKLSHKGSSKIVKAKNNISRKIELIYNGKSVVSGINNKTPFRSRKSVGSSPSNLEKRVKESFLGSRVLWTISEQGSRNTPSHSIEGFIEEEDQFNETDIGLFEPLLYQSNPIPAPGSQPQNECSSSSNLEIRGKESFNGSRVLYTISEQDSRNISSHSINGFIEEEDQFNEKTISLFEPLLYQSKPISAPGSQPQNE